jgi:Ca2+-binding RTX toxin-like protein
MSGTSTREPQIPPFQFDGGSASRGEAGTASFVKAFGSSGNIADTNAVFNGTATTSNSAKPNAGTVAVDLAGTGAATVPAGYSDLYVVNGSNITGSSDNQTAFIGNSSHFTIGSGADTVYAGGADTITGGSGADTIYGGGSGATVQGGAGRLFFAGGTGAVSVNGGAGDNTLVGGSGGNWTYLKGGSGNNTLIGGSFSGTSSLVGGAGNATILAYGSGPTYIRAADGNSVINGTLGTGPQLVFGPSSDHGSAIIALNNAADTVVSALSSTSAQQTTIIGGTGHDTYGFLMPQLGTGENDITIYGWKPTDTIAFSGIKGLTETQGDQGDYIAIPGFVSVLLVGINHNVLPADGALHETPGAA